MKIGTIIQLPDERVGTVVYNGLDGPGVKWGRHSVTENDLRGTSGGLYDDDVPDDFEWFPDAILRDPWPSCEDAGWEQAQCVGCWFNVIYLPETLLGTKGTNLKQEEGEER